MDQQRREQEAYAAAAQAAAVAQASSTAASAAASSAVTNLTGGALVVVRYEEISLDVGDIVVTDSTPHKMAVIPLPGEFGVALGVACALHIGSGDARYLDASLCMSLEDDEWFPLTPPGGRASRSLGNGGTTMWRLHGPFGNRLALTFFLRQAADGPAVTGTWRDIGIRAGVQYA